MRESIRNNGLSIALFGLFAFSLAGQYVSGWLDYNSEQMIHGETAVGAFEYLGEGHFWEALFENWESEFLQMSAFILLTVFLFQKGSSESRTPGTFERVDMVTGRKYWDKKTPWPVRKGGLVLKIYENSLSLALLLIFVGSFVLHGVSGAANYNEELVSHGAPPMTILEYMESSRFWFESFQNWQSEFLSIGVMIVLTIFLRQKGSPGSKPVDSPHSETGSH